MVAKDQTTIALERIDVDPVNPRQDVGDITELAASIREQGVLQPVVVRPKGDRYLLVIGRRRFAAAKRNRLESIPAVVREMTDQEAAIASLVENLQREDLAPLEEADAYRKLLEVTSWTQDQLAEHVHKSRPVITNALRILEAPQVIRAAVHDGRLSANLALVAMTIADPSLAIRLKLRKGVTRVELEQQVRYLNADWERVGPGAEAAARKLLEDAQRKHAAPELVTWQNPHGQLGESDAYGLQLVKALGKPPAAIAGVIPDDVAKSTRTHDRLCTCRAWGIEQQQGGGAFKLVRVCTIPVGWRRLQRELSSPALRERARAHSRREAEARSLATRALEPDVRKARFAPMRRRLTRGGLTGEPVRVVAFELARRDLRSPSAQAMVWERIRKLPLAKVRTLALDLAVEPAAIAGNNGGALRAVRAHYGLGKEVARR
jgi:ParB family chromosome partitioning protein